MCISTGKNPVVITAAWTGRTNEDGMIGSKYDKEADALYLKLADRKVAHTVEIDSATLADVDSAGQLVGVEVIRPGRDWPVDDILSRFDVTDGQARPFQELEDIPHRLPAPVLHLP